MSVMHRHIWKVVEKVEQPAPVELMQPGVEFVQKPGWHGMGGIDDISSRELLHRPVIVTYRCECGGEKVARV